MFEFFYFKNILILTGVKSKFFFDHSAGKILRSRVEIVFKMNTFFAIKKKNVGLYSFVDKHEWLKSCDPPSQSHLMSIYTKFFHKS